MLLDFRDRYQGFGSSSGGYQQQQYDTPSASDDHSSYMDSAMSSLSLTRNWSSFGKTAANAANYVKDIGSQATNKATALGGAITDKVVVYSFQF